MAKVEGREFRLPGYQGDIFGWSMNEMKTEELDSISGDKLESYYSFETKEFGQGGKLSFFIEAIDNKIFIQRGYSSHTGAIKNVI